MKCSAVIPAYNSESCIAYAIKSVLSQSIPLLEIIVVIDGATDKTKSIVEALQDEYKSHATQIHVISIANSGVSKARNIGINRASGELIALLDADDIWHIKKHEAVLSYFQKYNTDAICTALTNNKNSMPQNLDIHHGNERVNRYKFLFKNPIVTSSMTFKKNSFLLTNKFDESMRYAEDHRLWLDFLYLKLHIIKITLPLTFYSINHNKDSLSKKLLPMYIAEQSNFDYVRKKYNSNLIIIYSAKTFSFLKFIRRIVFSSITFFK